MPIKGIIYSEENKEAAYRLMKNIVPDQYEDKKLIYVLVKLELIRYDPSYDNFTVELPRWNPQYNSNKEKVVKYIEELAIAYRINELRYLNNDDDVKKLLILAVNHYPITSISDITQIEKQRINELLNYSTDKNKWNVLDLVSYYYKVKGETIRKMLPRPGEVSKLIPHLILHKDYLDAYFLYHLIEQYGEWDKKELKELRIGIKTYILEKFIGRKKRGE